MKFIMGNLERETRLELATPTLARCSLTLERISGVLKRKNAEFPSHPRSLTATKVNQAPRTGPTTLTR